MVKFFGINLLASSAAYAIYKIYRKEDAYIRFLVMLLFPFGGLVLLFILDMYKYFKKSPEVGSLDISGLLNQNNRHLFMTRANVSKDINTVPIEDALVLNDNTVKRTLIIDALKGDSFEYIGFLMKALKDSDTETSHYAATAITEVKRKLTLAIQELEVWYDFSKEDVSYLMAYCAVLKKYAESGLLDKRAYEKYMNTYSGVLSNLIALGGIDEYYYEEKVNCDLRLQRFEEAINYCYKYKSDYKMSDKPFILLMKIYFLRRDLKAFHNILEELRRSNVRLQGDSLKIIRFWLEGA